MTPAVPQMAYRGEVDGLRAIALLAVMAFHAGLGPVAGGYLGVDVFFVISGYLITSLVLAERANGQFALARFWKRRARCLLPMLTVVVLASLVPGWVLLPAQDAENFGQSLVAVGLWISNLLFWHEGTYFGPVGEFKPLLHTWSLGVEAQFYLLFPAVLLIAWRIGVGRKWLAAILVTGLLASLGFAQWLQVRDFHAAYFLLPARAWQLLLGAVCVFVPLMGAPWLRGLAALAGLGLILVATIDHGSVLETAGYGTLLAAGGAALVIVAAGPDTLVGRLLALRPLVAIGLVSYGAYLWHFPLLSFARHALLLGADPEPERIITLSAPLASALCLASLALAAASWRFIEQPGRNRTALPARRAIVLFASSWAIIGAVSISLLATDWQQRFYLSHVIGAPAEDVAVMLAARRLSDRAPFDTRTRDDGACVFATSSIAAIDSTRLEGCRRQHGPGLLLVGDSHGEDVHNVMAHIGEERAFVVSLVAPTCRIADDACYYPTLAADILGNRGNWIGQIAYTQSGSTLILDARGWGDSQLAFISPAIARIDRATVRTIFARLADLQTATGKPVLMLGPYYEPRINIANNQPLRTGWVPRPTIRRQFSQLDRYLQDSAKQAGITYLSLLVGELAPQDRVLEAGCLIYEDLDHLSDCGEDLFAQHLQAIDHPLVTLVRDGGRNGPE